MCTQATNVCCSPWTPWTCFLTVRDILCFMHVGTPSAVGNGWHLVHAPCTAICDTLSGQYLRVRAGAGPRTER